MTSPRAILYLDSSPESQSVFLEAFAAAGYQVVTAQSLGQAALRSLEPGIQAVVINGTCSVEGPSEAEKIKFLNPELPVVMICPESQINDPLPPWVDAGTCSATPEAAVIAIMTFLSVRGKVPVWVEA